MGESVFFSALGETLWVIALVSAPVLIPMFIVGIVIGIIQTATSIMEQTLSFIPKLLIMLLSLAVLGGLMMGLLMDFTAELFAIIPQLTK